MVETKHVRGNPRPAHIHVCDNVCVLYHSGEEVTCAAVYVDWPNVWYFRKDK